jgi:hypothetical protein
MRLKTFLQENGSRQESGYFTKRNKKEDRRQWVVHEKWKQKASK